MTVTNNGYTSLLYVDMGEDETIWNFLHLNMLKQADSECCQEKVKTHMKCNLAPLTCEFHFLFECRAYVDCHR